MLGLGSAIQNQDRVHYLLAEYKSNFGSSNSQDGWVGWSIDTSSAVATGTTSLTFNGSDSAGGYTLIAFTNDQSDDAGLIKVNFGTSDLGFLGLEGDYLEISFGITCGTSSGVWEAGDGSDIPMVVQWGGQKSPEFSVPLTNHNSGITRIETTVKAIGSYSGNINGNIALVCSTGNNNLPQNGASMTLRDVIAKAYRP